MKFIVTCIALTLVYCAEVQSHSREWGIHEIGQTRLYNQTFIKEASSQEVERDTMQYAGIPTITYIDVTDHYTKGEGGFPTLLSGGPGYGEVEIEFMSQPGKGYNFNVEIWGI